MRHTAPAAALAAAGACWVLALHVLISRWITTLPAPAVSEHSIHLAAAVCLGAGSVAGLAVLSRLFSCARPLEPQRRAGSAVSWVLWGVSLGIVVNGTCPAVLTLLGRGRIAMVPPLPLEAALLTLASYAASTVWEEIVFRRFLIRALRPLGVAPAVLVSTVLFASFHFLTEDLKWSRLIFLTAFGILLGVAYWRSGRLVFTIGIHGGLNLMHLALGGDPGFPALWPFVTRMKDSQLTPLLFLGILLAGTLAAFLVKERQIETVSRIATLTE
jgi:membrane protease YdiL (CAAX protease family)